MFGIKPSSSMIAPLRNDPHQGKGEQLTPGEHLFARAELVRGLHAVAERLCDVVIQLDSMYRVKEASGHVDAFFQSQVEGGGFLDVAVPADRALLEAALSTITLACPRVVSVVLLVDGGIGTTSAKLMIMATTLDNPRYIVGVRSENTEGLTEAHESLCATGFGSDHMDMFGNNLSEDGEGRHLSGGRRASCFSSASQERRDNVATPTRLRRTSCTSRQSMHSETSFSISNAASLALSSSTTPSILSSFFSSRRNLHRSPTARSAPLPSSPSWASSRTRQAAASSQKSKAAPAPAAKQEAGTQTEVFLAAADVETQTEAAHVPGTRTLLRPPLDPSVRKSRLSSSTVTSPRGSMKSRNSENTILSSRRSSRCTSGGKQSDWSASSEDLVLRHFQTTPQMTLAYALDTLASQVNAHLGSSCCPWHATLHAVSRSLASLREKPCKTSSWLPASGWQCGECLALNDVEQDECSICCGDRDTTPPPERSSSKRGSSGSAGESRQAPRTSKTSVPKKLPTELPGLVVEEIM